MKAAIRMELKADRKEPLGDPIRGVAALFERAGGQADRKKERSLLAQEPLR